MPKYILLTPLSLCILLLPLLGYSQLNESKNTYHTVDSLVNERGADYRSSAVIINQSYTRDFWLSRVPHFGMGLGSREDWHRFHPRRTRLFTFLWDLNLATKSTNGAAIFFGGGGLRYGQVWQVYALPLLGGRLVASAGGAAQLRVAGKTHTGNTNNGFTMEGFLGIGPQGYISWEGQVLGRFPLRMSYDFRFPLLSAAYRPEYIWPTPLPIAEEGAGSLLSIFDFGHLGQVAYYYSELSIAMAFWENKRRSSPAWIKLDFGLNYERYSFRNFSRSYIMYLGIGTMKRF